MPQANPARVNSLADVLSEDACPLCSLLKEFQASYLREPAAASLESVCSFHMWMIAKTAEAETAAALYLRFLDRGANYGLVSHTCDVCTHIRREESARVKEFAGQLERPETAKWLREQGAVCVPHARSLLGHLPEQLQSDVLLALNRRGAELRKKLVHLVREAQGRRPVHGGVLGRVAEYLVAQRGLGLRS
jgi:hypothetical protein